MTIQFRSPTAPMLERLHPMLSSIGLRNTARVKRVPIDSVMMTNAAPSTIQPSKRRCFIDSAARSAAASRQHGLDGLQILLGVDADGRLNGLEDANGDAFFEQAELLQSLRPLER